MDELQATVEQMLKEYLSDAVDASMISVLSSRAMLAFQEYVNYPSTMTGEAILADMTTHKSCIADLALYEAIQQGAEFQSMHIESGLYRMWNSKGSVYTQHGVVPYATM